MNQNWEYRVEDLPTKNMSNAQIIAERSAATNFLNQLGSQGWELVAIQGNGVWGVYAYLKRPKP